MSIRKILKALQKNKIFLISGHVNPDVDVLASELALALFLKSQGKKVFVVNPDAVPRMYQFLPGVRAIKKFNGQNFNYDAAIILDCGDLGRIEKIQSILKKSRILINIDHHVTNREFGDLNLVDVKASSTSEIIFTLLKQARYQLDRKIAGLLYLGIMTDTGSFRYDNTTSYTHGIVSELLKFKISPRAMHRDIYENVPPADLKLFLKIIRHFDMCCRGRVAVVALRNETFKKFSDEFDLREKIFSLLRTVRGIEVIVILTEINKRLVRLNFRSQGKADVARLAAFYHGGGHKRASGGRVEASLRKAKKDILRRLKVVL